MGRGERFLGEIRGLLDLFLPELCPLCELGTPAGAGEFCPACLRDLPLLGSPRCPLCALPFLTLHGDDHRCEACLREPPPFLGVHAAGSYEGLLARAVRELKYRRRVDLARPLGRLLVDRFSETDPPPAPDLILPVPLHPSRLRERTFNQALLVAREVGRQLGLPVPARLLRRKLATASQQGLRAAERRANLHGAFLLSERVDGRNLLLVDDVMTTGATARECARTLLSAGAASVTVAVLGRATRTRP